MPGQALEGLKARHPFIERDSVFILGEHVTLEQGTGCVHTAPGHGQEDYEMGLKYRLEIYNPVGDDGRFLPETPLFAGMSVWEANPKIVDKLRADGFLLKEERITHSYPHCWRCKNPVIFRGTAQWFISMQANDLRRRALEEIRRVQWIPPWGEERIYNMVESRPDWCISRQRAWGVPITVFYCQSCQATLARQELAEHVATWSSTRVRTSGSSATLPTCSPLATAVPNAAATALPKRRISWMSGSIPESATPPCWNDIPTSPGRPTSTSKAATSIAAGSIPRC